MTSETVRSFIALEMPEAARTKVAGAIESLRPRFPGLRWLSPETIHLTLRFLGAATPAQIENLRPALEAAARACPASEAHVAGLGTFPGVLWLRIDVPEPILELQRACEAAARSCGFAAEERPFRSHVTLGRWRERPPKRPELPEVDLGHALLESLVLYESRLHPQGAVHTPLASFALSSSNP